ncbi:MAG TPA: protein kinase [Myxococcaceae bacterium]|jgi:tetratricopeptide (TPR) repeat protein/predicted Ser/Thr protein kinase
MDPARYARLTEVFLGVSPLPEEERPAALDQACAGDPELLAEVMALLAHQQDASLIAGSDTGPTSMAVQALPGPAPPAGTLVGRRVGGILVEKQLAEGGMGTVYLGLDERLRRRVALKAIRGEWRLEPQVRARFLREARVLSQLKHPNICQIHDYVETPDSDYLVLEYIDGHGLQEVIAGRPPLAERDRIGATIAEVLQVAHGAGVVHRDLKPDNVVLTAGGQVKVLDFGIARVVDDKAEAAAPRPGPTSVEGARVNAGDTVGFRTRAGDLIGTMRYMSPEQARGELAGPASDIYALGLVLHEMYTGRRAFPPDLEGAVLHERLRAGRIDPARWTSRPRRRLVERMLSMAPGARPTATEVAQELRRIRELPRRRLLQTLGAVGLGLSALAGAKYVTDVRAGRIQAEEARAQAERERAAEERLATFVLEQLYDDLYWQGRHEAVELVSGRTLRFFEELPETARPSPVRMARALRNHGSILLRGGKYQTAAGAFERALQMDEVAAARAATPREITEALEGLGGDLGLLLGVAWGEYDVERGKALARRSFDIYERLAREHPGEVREQGALANAWGNMGWSHLYEGDMAASRSAFEHAAEVYRHLLEAEPGNQSWRFHLGDVRRMIGDAQLFLGEVDAALASYTESCRMLDALAAESPQVPNYPGFAAEGYLALGRALARKGDLPGAQAAIEKARAAFQRNMEQDPSRRRWPNLLLETQLAASRVLRRQGKEAEARALLLRVAAPTLDDGAQSDAQATWAEVQLELDRREAARLVVERLVARGWHRTPIHAEFAHLARRHGFIP